MQKNKVKSLTENKTIFLLGVEQKSNLNQFIQFDKSGSRVKEIQYKEDGSIDCINTIGYNSDGNLIFKKGINADSSIVYKVTVSYDENKNRKELFFYLPDGTYKYRTISTYDRDGRMTELSWYWPTGFKSKNQYQYIGRRKIKDTEYDPQGKFTYVWEYEYDEKGNVISAKQFYPHNIINGKITYEFNKDNLLIKQVNYFGESIQGILTFEYDNKELLSTKTEYNSKGSVSAKYTYQYVFF